MRGHRGPGEIPRGSSSSFLSFCLPLFPLLAPPLADRTRRKCVVTREFNPFFFAMRVPFVSRSPPLSPPHFSSSRPISQRCTARRGVSTSLSPWFPRREISCEYSYRQSEVRRMGPLVVLLALPDYFIFIFSFLFFLGHCGGKKCSARCLRN